MEKYSSIEELRLLGNCALESSLAGYWDWNMVTNEEYLSPRFKAMFGYAEHEMDNTPDAWQKIAYQEDLPQMFEKFTEHVQSHGKIPFNSVVRYYHKNGKTIWVRCNGKVVEWSENNEPLRAIGCHIDITKEKMNESRLESLAKDLDILYKELHHRVKNNLQIILSLIEIKSEEIKSEETKEILEWLKGQVHSVSFLHKSLYMGDSKEKEMLLSQYFHDLIVNTVGANAEVQVLFPDFNISYDKITSLGMIIHELAMNSLKHANISEERIKITLNVELDGDSLDIVYYDNGKIDSVDLIKKGFGIKLIELLISDTPASKLRYEATELGLKVNFRSKM